MSNHLAVATVTAALRSVIEDAIRDEVDEAKVTHLRPGAESSTTATVRVNVFLYGVSPNAAARNDDAPTRRADGGVAQRPRAALDLNYLISFYGNDAALESQRMLGCVVRALHAHPMLSRARLRGLVQDPDLDESHEWLARSNLAEAPEAVRFTPVPLSLEELSKLWSVLFQTPYALSLAYQGTLVSIEADEPASAALPVRARNVYALSLRQPEVASVAALEGAAEPILPTSTLVVRGRHLGGDVVRARLAGSGLEAEPAWAGPNELHLPLSTFPLADLRAGVQGVQVIHLLPLGTPPTPHRGQESNVAPFVLRPAVRTNPDDTDAAVFLPSGDPQQPGAVEVMLDPPVARGQRVELLLNAMDGDGAPAYRFPRSPPAVDTPTGVVSFPAPGVAAGTYLVRVRVDGAESVLRAEAGALARPALVVS